MFACATVCLVNRLFAWPSISHPSSQQRCRGCTTGHEEVPCAPCVPVPVQVMKQIMYGPKPTLPDTVSTALAEIVAALLTKDINKRPMISEVAAVWNGRELCVHVRLQLRVSWFPYPKSHAQSPC